MHRLLKKGGREKPPPYKHAAAKGKITGNHLEAMKIYEKLAQPYINIGAKVPSDNVMCAEIAKEMPYTAQTIKSYIRAVRVYRRSISEAEDTSQDNPQEHKTDKEKNTTKEGEARAPPSVLLDCVVMCR